MDVTAFNSIYRLPEICAWFPFELLFPLPCAVNLIDCETNVLCGVCVGMCV